MKYAIHYFLISTLLVFTPIASQAQKRCPANDSNCTIDDSAGRIRDRVNEGAKDVGEAKGPIAKAKEVRKTVKDCIKCGVDGVIDGAKKITGQRDSDKIPRMDD